MVAICHMKRFSQARKRCSESERRMSTIDQRDVSQTLSSVTLLVLGDDLNPPLVSRALGMFPDRAWQKGQTLEISAADGRLLQVGDPAPWGGWKKFIPPHLEQALLEEQLAFWVERLQGLAKEVEDFRRLDWTVTLDCLLTTSVAEVAELKHELLCGLAAIGVDVDIHFHPCQES